MTKRYEVQHYTLCDGWINTWSDYDEDGNETPSTYDSFEDALNELDSFLDDEQEAFEEGNIESPYDRDEFRIAEVEHEHN